MNKTTDKKQLFENTPVPRAILTLAIPTIISQLISVIYNIADTFFVGRTGDPYMIAGVSLSLPLFVMTVAFGNLFGIGGGSLISRMMGAGDEGKAKSISALSIFGAFGVSLLYAALVYAFINPLLYTLGASDSTLLYARQYTTFVVVFGSIPIVVASVESHLLRNVGYSTLAGLGLSGGGILNIILDPLFMFVLFPKGQEVLAAAVATLISNVIALAFLTAMLIRVSRTSPLSVSPADLLKLDKPSVSALFSVGVPSALLPGLLDISNMVLNSHFAMHGDLELAAIGIVMKLERIPNAINVGISQGMLPLVAYNYSSGNSGRMKSIISTARKMGICTSIAGIAMFELFSGAFVGVFLSGSSNTAAAASTLAMAAVFLRLRCTASPFQFLSYHSSFCMQAMGYGKGTLIHAFVRIMVFYIPLIILLDALFGVYGLALSLTVGEFCTDFVALGLLTYWINKTEREGSLAMVD